MAINKIGGVTTASGASDEKSEYDKWKILEKNRDADIKFNTRMSFRRSTGASAEEYKAQAQKSKMIGFEALLDEKRQKIREQKRDSLAS